MNFAEAAKKRLAELGTHTLNDVLEAIERGEMVSFTEGDTWVVMQPMDFPRKRVAQIFLVVGRGRELDKVWQAVLCWAESNKVDEIWGWGRPGWEKYRRNKADIFGFWRGDRTLYRRIV